MFQVTLRDSQMVKVQNLGTQPSVESALTFAAHWMKGAGCLIVDARNGQTGVLLYEVTGTFPYLVEIENAFLSVNGRKISDTMGMVALVPDIES